MTNEQLRKLAIESTLHCHSPYSKAKVGSVILTSQDDVFTGCNIENSSFGATICAERVAIVKAVSSGQSHFKKIYVYTEDGWPPCGLCLQMLSEFADEKTQIIIGDQHETKSVSSLADFLPKAFTPSHLIKDHK